MKLTKGKNTYPIILVDPRKSEGTNPGEDDQGEKVEPGPDVSETYKAGCELECVKPLLAEQEGPELSHGGVSEAGGGAGHLAHPLGWDGQLQAGQVVQRVRAGGRQVLV